MTEQNNIEAIAAALRAVHEANKEYVPLHEAYMLSMQSAGGYEPVPGYTPKPGELLTPDTVISMIATGEINKIGLTNAVNAGKIRKITAVKSPALIAAEAELTAKIEEYHRICDAAVAMIAVKKTGKRGTVSTGAEGKIHGIPSPEKKAEVTAAIKAFAPNATVQFNGRRVFGTLSEGAMSFDYDVHGQSYLATLEETYLRSQ